MKIGDREIRTGLPTFIIAEVSANHNQSFDRAVEIIHAAHRAGADAVKLQTYTPDTITLDCDSDIFRIKGTSWDGLTLHELYKKAFTPWDWQARLKSMIEGLGMKFFSSPFDASAVDFLEAIGTSAYKVASSELVDIPLLERIASTGKSVVVSTGIATRDEIDEAVAVLHKGGVSGLLLLKCTASYPAPVEEMNLLTIPDMVARYGVPVGLSDHTMGIEAPVVAVALGACAIEKHLTLARADGGPDSGFSLEPAEFAQMVAAVRNAERSLGTVCYEPAPSESVARQYRRSLFVVENIRAGDVFTAQNLKSIRPGYGLHTRHLSEIIGRRAKRDVARGTPVSWDLLEDR